MSFGLGLTYLVPAAPCLGLCRLAPRPAAAGFGLAALAPAGLGLAYFGLFDAALLEVLTFSLAHLLVLRKSNRYSY